MHLPQFYKNQNGAVLFEYLMGFSIVAVITVATVSVLMTDTQNLAKKTTCRVESISQILQSDDINDWQGQIKEQWESSDCEE